MGYEPNKKRNQVNREMIERGPAGSGRHQVDQETAFQKGWRRSGKHKRSWLDQDLLHEENQLFEELKEALEEMIEISRR